MARKLSKGTMLAAVLGLLAAAPAPVSARSLIGEKVAFPSSLLLSGSAGPSGRRPARRVRQTRRARSRVHAADDCSAAHSIPRDDNLNDIGSATLCLLNRERVRRHLHRLRENPRLSQASAAHSRDMARRNYFEHTGPGGLTMVKRVLRVDYVNPNQGWMLGENIAWGSGSLATPAGIVRMWMHSPGHRANILSRSFKEIGIGVAVGVPVTVDAASGGATYTTDFGRRG